MTLHNRTILIKKSSLSFITPLELFRVNVRMKNSDKSNAINIQQKVDLVSQYWKPPVIAEMNDYQFKVSKLLGEFIMHTHTDTDETFIVLEGKLRIDFESSFIELNQGEMYVVKAGVAHKPYAESEVKLLLIEPKGVTNTGDQTCKETAPNDIWI